ncbi:hypothetical protein [Chryseobacterium gambrini]|uniref:hypothetical protein n=1 Tax=Chryseobacterium gambrini TaxID=373672 RepID=UPI003D0BF95D
MNYVAKEAAIFYKNNGKSNLDNVKETKAYDVLIWASVQADEAAIMQEYYNSLKTT